MTISSRASLVKSRTRKTADLECELTSHMLIATASAGIGRTIRRSLMFCCFFVFTIGVLATSAGASPSQDGALVKVSNVHIGGFMDPHNEALINSTLDSSSQQGVSLYVIQLDSDGIAGANLKRLAKNLSEADFVTAVWIGPTSAAYSDELQPLLDSVDFVGAANKELAQKSNAEIVSSSLREFYADLDGRHQHQ